MASPHIPERLQRAVQLLDIAPEDEILEIGPGPGVSVSLICEHLAGGHITTMDRSAIAIQRAARRNADHVASGRAVFHHLDLADVDLVRRALGGQQFDKVFAVNVNLFWVRPAHAELQLIRDLLRPGGVLYLIYETPSGGRADPVAETVAAALAEHGFATIVTAASVPSLICITARPADPG
jgi:SAM-dependent methyltransferase